MKRVKAYAHKHKLCFPSQEARLLSRDLWAAIKPAATLFIDQSGLWSEAATLMDEMKELLGTDDAKEESSAIPGDVIYLPLICETPRSYFTEAAA